MAQVSLPQQWIDLFPAACKGRAVSWLTDIRERYTEPHRCYHVLRHIRHMLTAANKYFPDATIELKLAIWLHDAIYVPGSPLNELESASYAAQRYLAVMGHAPSAASSANRVAGLIVVTHDHQAESRDGRRLCDLDLLSLALPPSQYRKNTARIRQEYAGFDEERWQLGRRLFIERFLARRIYQTDDLYGRFEERARINLCAELDRLAT